MNHSRKMVLISEDEYTQLMTKIKENNTQAGQAQRDDTQSSQIVEKVTQPNVVSEKVTKAETMVTHFPIQSQCNLEKDTEKIPTENKVTKTNEASEKVVKNGADKLNITQLGSGEEKPRPRGPPGVPLRRRQKKINEGLPPGWVDF